MLGLGEAADDSKDRLDTSVFHDEEEELLRQAIALSLEIAQENDKGAKEDDKGDDHDDDELLKQAIALSLAD